MMGFLPPIKRSWLRALFKRPEERKPALTASKLVKVCDLAKLTCLVLGGRKESRKLSEISYIRPLSQDHHPSIHRLLNLLDSDPRSLDP